MAEDNNSRKNRLITYLLNYAYDHDIGYVLVESEPSNPSFAIKMNEKLALT